MRHLAMGLVLGFLLMGGTAFAAGDLIVEGNLGIGTTSPQSVIDAQGATASVLRRDFASGTMTNALSALQLGLGGAATFAAGSGPSLLFFAPDSTGQKEFVGRVSALWENPANGSEAGALVFQVRGSSGDVNAQTQVMRLTSSGNVGIGVSSPQYPLQMFSGAYVTIGGVWTDASSREYKDNISDLSIGSALTTLQMLNPVTYTCKADPEERHVGFIAEDVPDLVAAKSRDGLSPMDIVGVLTKVVQDQQRRIEKLESMLSLMK